MGHSLLAAVAVLVVAAAGHRGARAAQLVDAPASAGPHLRDPLMMSSDDSVSFLAVPPPPPGSCFVWEPSSATVRPASGLVRMRWSHAHNSWIWHGAHIS